MRDPISLGIARSDVIAQITSCTRCALSAGMPPPNRSCIPVPFRGSSPSSLMLLGEAPGNQEERIGKPFVGPSGQVLEEMFKEVGLPPLSTWFIANTVCCNPGEAPDAEQQLACLPNLRSQVRLADPEWVLAVGAIALKATQWTNEKITRIHGRPFRPMAGPFIDRWVLPTFHPAAGLRDPRRLADIRDDLSTMSRVLSGTLSVGTVRATLDRRGRLVGT